MTISLVAGCATSRNLDDAFSDFGADTKLKTVLFSDRTHDYSDIDLTVYEGRLLLTGTMRSEQGHQSLVANAWKADGVDQVIDEILIADKTGIGQGFEDARIDQAIRASFITDRVVRSGDFKIAVSKATVFLIGSADSEREINEALDIASNISGVEEVINHVVIRGAQPAY